MKMIHAFLIVTLVSITACAWKGAVRSSPLRSIDGLERVAVDLPGLLDLRAGHSIGSYDALLIPPAYLSYTRKSRRLTVDAERVFLELLRKSLIDAAEAYEIPIEQAAGPCVMEINLAVHGLNVTLGSRAEELAALTLVMQFRDSTSGETLLRYATDNHVANPSQGVTRDKHLQNGFDRIIDRMDMDMTAAAQATDLKYETIDPGCKGTFNATGRAASGAQAD